MKRAIFPLPIFILPQGYTRLRIFEPRYLNMVKTALENDTGFVLCTFEHDTPFNISAQGCLVDIIDFNQDDSGMLLIDVIASKTVQIDDVYQDEQELRHGLISNCIAPYWYSQSFADIGEHTKLKLTLQNIFSTNPELSELYKQTRFDELTWVVARWLELLPISIEKKQQLAFETNFDNLLSFLHTVINNEFA
ncbi:LON peptidase substrate-binding domain-containing protein [Pseudoalteromonas carrageenovora]|uniref:LON peptidase substrate-binding domain-containing protein n=1 Tax=Pseudoalteromonas TaxID=53246 RepID=UPI0026E14AEC|nr:LON peptidase substrate-binding domain-containing protein [Pseudoalteromonas carrageenovora]MDO6635072.1 LON peptidase substrate-binding domain-containing protein [Pseudoalteromonas carrageenovora]MDO6647612.1 LON peptidase substrate-binding domain-containing protein [Pseudoalteromonas carrageenovora]MDO6837012.1 LON peptidase substrate-binding domain-containing protein [Pseudoalteromonas carrageenovora]